MNYKLFILTTLTLIFFAANSLLCKAALIENHIDAFSFTFFRLFFAALVLLFLVFVVEKRVSTNLKSNWISSFSLFLYAIAFTYSYLSLDAGIGALILFAAIQLTMVIYAIIKKESITFQKLLGIIIAFCSLTYLLFPKDDFSISSFHFFLMVLAGIGSGFFTLMGKKSQNPLKDTADIFLKTIVFASIFFILFIDSTKFNSYGVLLAFISGGLTSGIGYALWYYVLRNIQIITASIIQLSVPIIAIFLSVLLLGEKLTSTLIISTLFILSGIFITIYKKA